MPLRISGDLHCKVTEDEVTEVFPMIEAHLVLQIKVGSNG